jgi:hypothetical protein
LHFEIDTPPTAGKNATFTFNLGLPSRGRKGTASFVPPAAKCVGERDSLFSVSVVFQVRNSESGIAISPFGKAKALGVHNSIKRIFEWDYNFPFNDNAALLRDGGHLQARGRLRALTAE